MTKKQITQQLTEQQLNPAYSGKNHTFYVDNYPIGVLLVDIQQSGFNVEKRKP